MENRSKMVKSEGSKMIYRTTAIALVGDDALIMGKQQRE